MIAIVGEDGTLAVEYTYDAWGNILSITGPQASTLGALNPLRYRSYVYDNETGLYYVSSRYYNPEIGRWINADAFPSTGQGLTGNNMFAYCGNNPVNRTDVGGFFWDTVFDVVSLCFSVAEVIENPDDPMAWLGVAADVASLVVPCVSGGGALVRAATKADDVVDAVKLINSTDNVGDAAKVIENVIDTSANSIKYTDKVIKQMNNTADLNHAFPSIIDTFVDINSGRPLKGGDGIMRKLIELPGSINNTPGVFEYIIEPNGMCNHRYFRKLR